DKGEWTTFTTEDGLAGSTVYDIAVAPDGALWFATGGGGVSRLDPDGTWETYTTEDGLAHDVVWAIAITPDGALWFGTEGGLSRFDGDSWTVYTMEDGLGQDFVTSLAVAPDGALWVGTWGGGVSRFDPAEGTWTTYAGESGLTQVYVLSVAVDVDGVVWVGARLPIEPKDSASGGIFRFDGEGNPDATWTFYSADIWATKGLNDDVLGDWVYDILVAPDGALWSATDGGVLQLMGRAGRSTRPSRAW
ncbi:MAG: two-component regulator propeller domain-containing protein, partial [Chloroflexota bacterium]